MPASICCYATLAWKPYWLYRSLIFQTKRGRDTLTEKGDNMHVILLTDVLINPEGETCSSCRNVWILSYFYVQTVFYRFVLNGWPLILILVFSFFRSLLSQMHRKIHWETICTINYTIISLRHNLRLFAKYISSCVTLIILLKRSHMYIKSLLSVAEWMIWIWFSSSELIITADTV